MPRTPGTPTMSQSFFFSDVASLARENTPQRGEPDAVKSAKKGLSNIICISPLASSRNRNGNPHQANTPINYHDIFASPNPLLEDSPVKAMLRARGGGNGQQQNGKNIDAVDMAERDLMQDEDLNVLLQLAGGNTPKAVKVAAGGHVFRGAGSGQGSKKENLPGLQLPVIGDREGDSSAARLSRKSHSRDTGESGGFVAPHLSIRQTDSTGAQSKDSNGSKSDVKADPPTSKLAPRTDSKAKPSPSSNGKPPVGQGYTKVHAASYPPRPHSQEMYGFPSMLPHGMRPSGRMSVVVGGPPPSSRAPKPSPGQARHPHRPPPGYSHEYPPPGMSYPPPPGHYPHHPVHMGAHPYHYGAPHHPPQRMPLYGQPPSSSHGSAAPSSSSKKDSKPAAAPKAKAPQKRPLPVSSGPPPAKKRKGSSPNGKRKPKSSPAPERVDRQKAAQSIASMNAASGGKNDKAAALAAAILRGVTMRPSGKWVRSKLALIYQ